MRVSASLSQAVMQVRISDRRFWPTLSRRHVSANDRLTWEPPLSLGWSYWPKRVETVWKLHFYRQDQIAGHVDQV
jgi:hypothetical protein